MNAATICKKKMWMTVLLRSMLRCCLAFSILHSEVLTVRATRKFLSSQPIFYKINTHVRTIVTQDSTASLQPDSAYMRVCPGDNVEVNCTATQSSFLLWKLNIPDKDLSEMEVFSRHTTEVFTLCGFSLALVANNSDELISSARVEDVGLSINGSVLTCFSTISASPEANETANITIFIEGINECSNVTFY